MPSYDDKTSRRLGLFERGRARSLTLPRHDEDAEGNLQFPLFGPPRRRPSSKVRDKRAARAARAAEVAAAVAEHYPDDGWRPCVGCAGGCGQGRCARFGF